MKTAITTLSETRKRLEIQIPAEKVDSAFNKLVKSHQRRVKLSGFRPGKVPIHIVRQRFKEDILHAVADDLVPQAIEEALREEGLVPIDTPDVRDVSIDEGQPLTFHALFEVMPSIAGLDYEAITLRKTTVTPDADASERALDQLRLRASTLDPITDRAIETGDIVTIDLTQHAINAPKGSPAAPPQNRREDVLIEVGSDTNPPGFDAELIGLDSGETKKFDLSYPTNYEQSELAGTVVSYDITVKATHRRKFPDLDDEFARSVGNFDTLDALKTQIEEDLRREAQIEEQRSVRRDLMSQLAARVTVELPEALVDQEISRRLEQIATRLAQQQVDPRKANINWDNLREEQRAPALETVCGTMVLDEVARREELSISENDLEREIQAYAERLKQTPAAVRAQLARDNGMSALSEGMRREKAIDFLLSRATIVNA